MCFTQLVRTLLTGQPWCFRSGAPISCQSLLRRRWMARLSMSWTNSTPRLSICCPVNLCWLAGANYTSSAKDLKSLRGGGCPGGATSSSKEGNGNAKERIGTKQQVPSAFFSQPQWHAAFREIQWRDLPAEAIIPYVVQQNGRPCFIIAHLFSGRRRKEDFHRWLQHCSIEYDIDLCILSLDTAISPSAGDLHRSAMAPP